MPSVTFLFPNVELRLDVPTAQGRSINLHMLFSPDDPEHVATIERILSHLTFKYDGSTYACSTKDLERLGRATQGSIPEDGAALRVGVNQFKTSIDDVLDLFEKEKSWLEANCLLAVAVAEGDGTGGLKGDSSYKALRTKIERAADIIFSGKPSDREYWIGRKMGYDKETIVRAYGGVKPCLHGSDAHSEAQVGDPAEGRSCWIRADPTFEGLRQAVLEPERRVFIGTEPPGVRGTHERISAIEVSGAPWFGWKHIPVNDGMVAIIGARGSGKTALADFLVVGAGALRVPLPGSSFVARAGPHLAGGRVALRWGGDLGPAVDLAPTDDSDVPCRARDLSQHFVDQLCSADGLAHDLLREIEAVVFEATDESRRLEAADFAALRDLRLKTTSIRISDRHDALRSITTKIAEEAELDRQLEAKEKELIGRKARVAELRREVEALVPKEKDARLRRLAEVENASELVGKRVQTLEVRKQRVLELRAEVARIVEADQRRLEDLRSEFQDVGLQPAEWQQFARHFVGDPDEPLRARLSVIDKLLVSEEKGHPADPSAAKPDEFGTWSLDALRAERERLKGAVGADRVLEPRDLTKNKERAQFDARVAQLEKTVGSMRGAHTRMTALVTQRRAAYAAVFDGLKERQVVLEELYEPLRSRLALGGGVVKKLEFRARRIVDLDAWVKRGESLLDLRAAGVLRGHGALKAAAQGTLLDAWREGDAQSVARAMETFIEKYGADIRLRPPGFATDADAGRWLKDVATWLFSTDHVSLEYGIRYDGVELERLSPGSRGIVLLVLYLAVDEADHRPLIVDQPEENLDPQSVFEELVEYFRQARDRRQVILVTHNPNLVVNADADQVIVAHATRDGDGLPRRWASAHRVRGRRPRAPEDPGDGLQVVGGWRGCVSGARAALSTSAPPLVRSCRKQRSSKRAADEVLQHFVDKRVTENSPTDCYAVSPMWMPWSGTAGFSHQTSSSSPPYEGVAVLAVRDLWAPFLQQGGPQLGVSHVLEFAQPHDGLVSTTAAGSFGGIVDASRSTPQDPA